MDLRIYFSRKLNNFLRLLLCLLPSCVNHDKDDDFSHIIYSGPEQV